jgi:phosphoglycolate phosphatase
MHDQSLVVLDVDNTIYDWASLWAGAFAAALRVLTERTDRTFDHWITAAHAVHVRRAATECPSMLCDLAAATTWPSAIDPAVVMPQAAAAYRDYWDHHLAAYPGVHDVLGELTATGHGVVAYTEGDASIAATRLARVGLAGSIRRVFGRPSLPAAPRADWCTVNIARNCPIAVDFIPREESKPNPTGLRTIIAMCGSSPQNTVYVGDNLFKDVAMARVLGAGAMWARYGAARDPAHQAMLDRVAHWTPEAVVRERSVSLESVTPDAVLDDPRELTQAIARRALSVPSC